MIRLTKIYTRTGDDGTTGLADGARVRKDDARVRAYGDVDEANAAVGLAIVAAEGEPTRAEMAALLMTIQHDLFDLGADLATPVVNDETAGARLRIIASQVVRLEKAIDRYNEPLGALTSFVLPGGTALAAALHLARTVTRRAERVAVTLAGVDPEGVNPEAVRYLNRLSDLLFVLSRVANRSGDGDVLWKPGATRHG